MLCARTAFAVMILGAAGCASMNDAMTPSATVVQDKFDNSTIVRQDPVSAAAGLSDAWHTLGFEWISKFPKQVFVTAGTNGTTRISGVAFNADGRIFDQIEFASEHTEFPDGWSTRRFVMPLADFLTVARAQSVQMKLSQGNNYTVSSFGPAYPMAAVNKKIPPFLDKVLQLSAGL